MVLAQRDISANTWTGQPFDIVKVRLQTTSQYSNAFDCAAKILKNEGPLAFYKGTLTPLIGIGACVSVQSISLAFERSKRRSPPSSTESIFPFSYIFFLFFRFHLSRLHKHQKTC
ncbi:hypothetical protein VTN02DRAFT_685 [Thermoascus thermophilus]